MIRHIRVNGYDMTYLDAGTGAPLLLIHGSLCDYRYWGAQIRPLSKAHRIVAVSLRHCYPERWDGIGADYTCVQHAADIGALLEALDAGPAHVMGHSRGGYVAFTVARQFPQHVRSLILADPGGRLDESLTSAPTPASTTTAPTFLRECAELIKRGDIDGGLAKFTEAVNGPGAWTKTPEFGKMMMRDNAYTLMGQIAERREPYSRAAIQEIKAPTVIINGDRSPALFHQIAAAMVENLRDGRRVLIEGAGHPMNTGGQTHSMHRCSNSSHSVRNMQVRGLWRPVRKPQHIKR